MKIGLKLNFRRVKSHCAVVESGSEGEQSALKKMTSLDLTLKDLYPPGRKKLLNLSIIPQIYFFTNYNEVFRFKKYLSWLRQCL